MKKKIFDFFKFVDWNTPLMHIDIDNVPDASIC